MYIYNGRAGVDLTPSRGGPIGGCRICKKHPEYPVKGISSIEGVDPVPLIGQLGVQNLYFTPIYP
jgi:hypothetical protein